MNLMKHLIEHPAVEDGGWAVARYDWDRDASTGSTGLGSSRDAAQAHGLKLGILLSEGGAKLRNIHFIAHSAGNWAARRASEYLRNIYGDAIKIQVTSLDPFVNDFDVTLDGQDLEFAA